MNNKSRLIMMAAAFLFGGIISGCDKTEQEVPETGAATVRIEIDRSFAVDSTSVSVSFIPSENATGFRYAIGLSEDFQSFVDGTLSVSSDYSGQVMGNEPVDVTFEGLDPVSLYSVFAVAIDENGIEGSVASTKIVTDANDFLVENSFLLSRAATFQIEISSDYASVVYYFGQDGDLDAFLSGQLETGSVSEVSHMTLNYFDLVPDSDYVFFAQVIDRFGITAKVFDIPVHTPAVGDCPNVTLEYENDIYNGYYVLSQSSGCARIAAIINTEGSYDGIISNTLNWSGDVAAMIDSWSGVEGAQVFQSEGSEDLTVYFQTPSLICSNPLEMFVLLYGEDGEPCGVDRFRFSTPAEDPDAPEAVASVTVRDITSSGATYEYTMPEDTFACMYDTVDADWFDELRESEEYTEYYLHDLLFSQGYYYHYNDGTPSGMSWTFTETAGQPDYRYYAVACPMNCNGPASGWGDLVMVEYRTLSE